MGARLREIRLKRGFTQDEVAARMGLAGKGRKTFVGRLEQGNIKNPSLGTVTLYLRACGAQFFEFYDTLTRIEPVLVDTRPIERTPMKREQKEMLLRRVKREVYNYQDETSYPKRGKPISPAKQKPAAAKLADYRVQVAVIEQEVKKLLGTENVTFVEIAGYLTVARRIRGELRRAVREHASGDTLVRGHDPELRQFARQGTRSRIEALRVMSPRASGHSPSASWVQLRTT
jgi:transcriptional regulator with XRE-family HTH domain